MLLCKQKNGCTGSTLFIRKTRVGSNLCSSSSVSNEGKSLEDFKQLLLISKVDHNFVTVFKILSRYQIIFLCGMFPLVYYACADEHMPWLYGAAYFGTGISTIVASIYFLYSRRNFVYSLWINNKLNQIKVGYLTHLGRQKEVVYPLKSSNPLDDPELQFDKKFAKLKFTSNNIDFRVSLKGAIIADEKLFIRAFGPIALSVFNEQKR